MKLSLAITSYMRYEMTVESFAQVIDDPRIDDIVILDDCSTDNSFAKLVEHFKGNEKVRVIRQAQNRGMSRNKHDAIALAKNDWVIILDSDNIIAPNYLDALQLQWDKERFDHCIYMPSFAKPEFDFRDFEGQYFSREIKKLPVHNDTGNVLFNCCNYVVNKKLYVDIFSYNDKMKGSDTIWFNYLWYRKNNFFFVVPGMHYFHRVHPGSGFLQDAAYNMRKAEEVRKLIMTVI